MKDALEYGGYPKTVAESVDRLMEMLTEEELKKIAAMKEDDLILLHMGLGTHIRNSFGLWADNKELLGDCGGGFIHPDSASSVIIKALWEKLKNYNIDVEEK